MASEYDMRAEAVDSDIMSPLNLGASPEPVLRTVVAQSSQVVVLSNEAGHGAAPLLSMAQLEEATNNFSLDNKIGAGSFGDVYRGKLVDGREVVIKRGETMYRLSPRFNSELAFLSCLHNKHLVGFVGFLCENKGEREFLVYEYMKNGTLYHHLHALEGSSSVLNSWKMRINIALDASLGIEYLHNNYEGQSIVHGNINSKNILLDATWTARVSDFGLPFMFMKKVAETYGYRDAFKFMKKEAETDAYMDDFMFMKKEAETYGYMDDFMFMKKTFMKKGAEIDGYMDAEYLWEGTLTRKSDVYALGVVLMELLTGKTGKRAVDIVVSANLDEDLVKVLDPRVEQTSVNETKALMLVANTARKCVNSKRKDRPIMSEVVANLKKALAMAMCNDENHQQLPVFWGAWVEGKREMEREKYITEENGGKYNE